MDTTTKPVKLTKPQADLLRKLAFGERSISHGDRPSLALKQAGLAMSRAGTFPGRNIFAITPAGRAHPAAAA